MFSFDALAVTQLRASVVIMLMTKQMYIYILRVSLANEIQEMTVLISESGLRVKIVAGLPYDGGVLKTIGDSALDVAACWSQH